MKAIQIALLVIISLSVNAQTGEIIYSKKDLSNAQSMDANTEMSYERKKQFAGLMAKLGNSTQKLMFNEEAAIYVDITGELSDEINETSADGEPTMRMKVKRDANLEEYYTDLKGGNYIHKRDIFGKYFILNEVVDHPKWKMVQEQKDVLGYSCMKATSENEKGELATAWYTMSIPLAIGPNTWGGLPGTILELEESVDGTSYIATAVDLNANPELIVPSGGKKIGLKKFLKMEERKRKEREEMYGGNGRMIMIRE